MQAGDRKYIVGSYSRKFANMIASYIILYIKLILRSHKHDSLELCYLKIAFSLWQQYMEDAQLRATFYLQM